MGRMLNTEKAEVSKKPRPYRITIGGYRDARGIGPGQSLQCAMRARSLRGWLSRHVSISQSTGPYVWDAEKGRGCYTPPYGEHALEPRRMRTTKPDQEQADAWLLEARYKLPGLAGVEGSSVPLGEPQRLVEHRPALFLGANRRAHALAPPRRALGVLDIPATVFAGRHPAMIIRPAAPWFEGDGVDSSTVTSW